MFKQKYRKIKFAFILTYYCIFFNYLFNVLRNEYICRRHKQYNIKNDLFYGNWTLRTPVSFQNGFLIIFLYMLYSLNTNIILYVDCIHSGQI